MQLHNDHNYGIDYTECFLVCGVLFKMTRVLL